MYIAYIYEYICCLGVFGFQQECGIRVMLLKLLLERFMQHNTCVEFAMTTLRDALLEAQRLSPARRCCRRFWGDSRRPVRRISARLLSSSRR